MHRGVATHSLRTTNVHDEQLFRYFVSNKTNGKHECTSVILKSNCQDVYGKAKRDFAKAANIYRVFTKSLNNLKNLLILQLTIEMSEMFK